MSDYFNCPKCGIAPKPSDDHAKEQGVCDSCWTDYFMGEWYEQQMRSPTTKPTIQAQSRERIVY